MDVNSSGGSAITHEGNGYLRLGANSVSNQLVLAANGNVAIGTATPGSYKLYVNGNTWVQGSFETSGQLKAGTSVAIGSAGSGGYTLPAADGTNGYVLKTNGSGTVAWAADSGGGGTVTSVTAGTGMTQSGTSTVNPTLNVIGGTGITANANDIALTAAGAGSGSYGSTSNSTKIDTITLDAYGRVTAVATGATGSGNGTVTSIGTSGAITGGSPAITTTGTIAHSTSAGYKHVPSGGASKQYLKYSSSGTAVWSTVAWEDLPNISTLTALP
jgi:hypothetical protein